MNILDLVSSTPGAKILGVKIPKEKKPIALSKIYSPGEVIASFSVTGRAVPWKVAIRKSGQGPPTNPSLVRWKKEVKKAAVKAMEGRLPHAGTFEFRACFHLISRGQMPDVTNLVKSSEDACQGVIYLNDKFTRVIRVEYDPASDVDETTITIIAI